MSLLSTPSKTLMSTLRRSVLHAMALAAACCASSSALAQVTTESPEVVYSGDDAKPLRDLADQLGSAVAIYEYLHNNTEFKPYHGSRSGSVNTVMGQRGSDVDIATAMIAMLRYKGLPARYAVGTARIPSAQLSNWVGVPHLDTAIEVLKANGVQKVALSTDKSTVDMEHVWVEVFVPFDQYRGINTVSPAVDCAQSANSARCTWVALDASFKQKDYNGLNIDPYPALSFDYSGYYNAIKNNTASLRDKNPLAILEEQIGTWLRTNQPGKTLEDVADTGRIRSLREGLLPASLPYEVIGNVRRYDTVALHDAAVSSSGEPKKWGKTLSIEVTLKVGSTNSVFPAGTALLAELNTKRLTVTTEIKQGIQVVTTRLGGTTIATPGGFSTSNTPKIFDPMSIKVTMDGAPGYVSTVADRTISATYSGIVGGYYLVATGGESSNWSQVHRAANQLLGANDAHKIVFNPADPGLNGQPCDLPSGLNCTPYVDTTGNGWDASDPALLSDKTSLDDLTGGLLYVAASQYYAKVRAQIERSDQLMKTVTPIIGFLGVVSSVYEAEYIDGTAFSILPGGLLIDMKGMTVGGSYRKSEAALTYANRQFEFVGHIASSLEHETWQELTGYDAVSTVRGIQMSLASGASLVTAKRNSTTNDVTTFLGAMGFTSSTPSGFTFTQRVISNGFQTTKPTTWAHATTTGLEGFHAIKKSPTSVSDKRATTLTYRNDTWDAYIACFFNSIATLQGLGPNYVLGAGGACGVTWPAGTYSQEAVQFLQIGYGNNAMRGVNANFFNYLDANQGFIASDFVYRNVNLGVSDYVISSVESIRNDLQFRDITKSWAEYTMPSKWVTGSNYRFEVYIQREYLAPSNNLNALSFTISNRGLKAGGGYLDINAGAQAMVTLNNDKATGN